MPLTFKEETAISNLASMLYDFLPGSGDPKWKGHISFSSIARTLGIGYLYPDGNKEAAIKTLLEGAYGQDKSVFARLIKVVVREAITYRKKKGNALKSEDVEAVNGVLLDLRMKIPELWDSQFLESLSTDAFSAAQKKV